MQRIIVDWSDPHTTTMVNRTRSADPGGAVVCFDTVDGSRIHLRTTELAPEARIMSHDSVGSPDCQCHYAVCGFIVPAVRIWNHNPTPAGTPDWQAHAPGTTDLRPHPAALVYYHNTGRPGQLPRSTATIWQGDPGQDPEAFLGEILVQLPARDVLVA